MVLVIDKAQGISSNLDSDPDRPIAIKVDQDCLLDIGECVLNKSTSLSKSSNCFALLDSSMNLTTTSKVVDNRSKVVVPPLVAPRTKGKSKKGTRLHA